MSTEIDQRVVEMRFDNKHFEKNVQTSMNTLDKLKQKLDLRGASKGLENVNSAAKSCNLSPISNAVEGVKVKFSAMEVMAVTALSNITNSAVNAGKRMVKALTIEPVMSGFNEYETQINAVQTILANTKSKGSTLDDVNSAFDELNKYADKTIYNFTEMTRNIGTFTAAGIDLETSVNAIQGIANLAAVSGSTSQQASTAMYQLSQALAAGTVKLMDWNSVVNAGMGGEIFQEALKKTSEELKTGAAAAIEAEGSFRESLKTGWLTSEVLTETLKKFTTSGANEYVAEYTGLSKEAIETALKDAKAKYGEADAIKYASKALAEKSGKNEEEIKSALEMASTAEDAATKVKTFSQLWDTLKESAQSGWTQTWELIIGDFGQAKELLTGISDFVGNIIQKISDTRNDILKGALGKTFSNLSDKINKVLSPAKKAVDTVNNVKEAVSDLGNVVNDVILGKFGNGKERIDKLTESGQNYYRVQNKVNEMLGNTFRYTDEQIEAQDKLLGVKKETADATSDETSETVKLTDEKKNLIKKIASMTEEQMRSNGYTDEQIEAFKELGKTADKLGMPLDEFIDKMDEIDGRWLLIDSFKSIGKSLIEVFKAIGEAWKNVFPSTIDDKANTLFNIIAAFHKFSRGILTTATKNADKFRRTFEGLFAILDLVRTIAGGALGFAFKLLKAVLDSMNLNILDVTANIGDAIVAFRNWVKEHNFVVKALEKVGSFIGKAIVAIRDFFKMVLEISEVQNAITNFKSACSNVFSNIGDFFSEGGKRIQEFIDRVKAMDSITLDDLGKIFEDFRTNVLGYFFNFDAIFDGVKNALSWLRDRISECISEIGDKFEWIKDKLSGLLGFIKDHIPQIIALVMGFGIIKSLKKIGDALEILSSPLEGLSDILENTAKVLKSFSGYIKAKAWKTKADAVLTLAIALGVLTACIVALTMVDPEKLWTAVGALGALMGIMAVFTLFITLIGKLGTADSKGIGKGLGAMALSMLGMAAALSILVESLKKMEELDPNKIWGNLGILAIVATGLTALSIVLSKLGGKNAFGAALSMIAIVAALKMMVEVLVDLGNADLTNAFKSIALLTVIVVGFAILLKSCRNVKMSGAVALIGIVIALKLVIGVMKTLAQMDTAEINKGLRGIIPLLLMFSLVMAASKLAGKNAAKAGIGILAMSLAIVVLVSAIKQIGGINQIDLERGLQAISTIMLLFGAIIAVSFFAGKNAIKAGVMLLMMSGAILILTGVIWALQGITDDGLKRALVAISVLSTIFAVLISVSKLASNSKSAIFALTIAIVALSAAVIALTFLDPSSLRNATLSLSLIIGTFALLVSALGLIKKENIGSSLGAIFALTIVAIALAAILAALTNLPNTSALIPAAGALSILLLALSGSLLILSKAGEIAKGTIGAAYALSGVIAILGVILGAMSFLPNPQPLIMSAISLSILLTALSGALLILSKVGTISASTIGAAYALSGVVAILAIILGVLAYFDVTPSLATVSALSIMLLTLSGAMFILSNIGTIASTTIGAAYALSGVIAVLAGILGVLAYFDVTPSITAATAISVLLISLSGSLVILSSISSVSASAIEAAYALSGVIAVLAGILGVLATINPQGPILEIAASLSLMLLSLSACCVVLCAIGVNVATAASAALGLSAFVGILALLLVALGGLAQIPGFTWLVGEGGQLLSQLGYALGSFVGSIVGGLGAGITSGLPEIAENLTAFGNGIQPFITIMSGIKSEAIDGIKNLAAAILVLTAAELIDSITSFLFGGNSMADFADSLGDMGKGLKTFSDEIEGINPENVKAGSEALKILAEAADKIPNDGGVAGFFAGENNIGDFVSKLPDVGTNLKTFSNNLEGINTTNITSGAEALKAIATAASEIPNDGGVAGFFAGENNIGTFVSHLPTVGTNLKTFSDNLEGINTTNITSGAEALKAIALTANEIPNDGGVAGFFAGENNIGTFVAALPGVGSNLKLFSDNLEGMNATNVTSGAEALLSIIQAAAQIPDEGGVVSWFAGDNSIKTFSEHLPTVGTNLKSFSDNLSGFSLKTVSDGMTAVSIICTNLNGTAIGSGMSSALSDDSLQNYIKKLAEIGIDVKKFSDNLSGFSSKNISSGIEAIKNIASMVINLPENSDKMTTFGTKLTSFGKNLKKYFSDMSDVSKESISNATASISSINKISNMISVEKATAATEAVGKLVKMVKSTSSVKANSTSGFVSALNNLAKVSINTIASKFKSYSPKMAEMGKTVIAKFIEGAKNRSKNIGEIGTSIMTKFIDSIGKQKSKTNKLGKILVDQLSTGIKSQVYKFKNVAVELMKKFIDAIKSKQSDAKKAIKNVVTECIRSARIETVDAKFVGKNFVIGFSNGISASTYIAEAKARAMAIAALRAAKKALNEHSPSKETYLIGSFFGQGFVNAIEDYNSKSYDAAYTIANYAKKGLSRAISKINDIINGDFDTQPTIRPVLDLSNVRTGIGAIDSMLNRRPSIGVMSDIGVISSMMNRNNQNGVDNDIVSAIKDLGNKINNASGDTYNVNGITYDDGSNISDAVKSLVRAAKVERRI